MIDRHRGRFEAIEQVADFVYRWPIQSNPFSQADAGAELKRLEKWLAKTEEKLDGGKIVVGVQTIHS